MGRILQMHSNHRKDNIDCCYAGDIAVAVGLKNTTTGDTCDENHPIILESMKFPDRYPRVLLHELPRDQAFQHEKMGIALAKAGQRGPTSRPVTH